MKKDKITDLTGGEGEKKFEEKTLKYKITDACSVGKKGEILTYEEVQHRIADEVCRKCPSGASYMTLTEEQDELWYQVKDCLEVVDEM